MTKPLGIQHVTGALKWDQRPVSQFYELIEKYRSEKTSSIFLKKQQQPTCKTTHITI